MKSDAGAIGRQLRHIADRMVSLANEIAKCERGEYSRVMSDERFEAIVAEALTFTGQSRQDVCLGMRTAHHCSRCEGLVEAWMARPEYAELWAMTELDQLKALGDGTPLTLNGVPLPITGGFPMPETGE